MRRLLLVSLFFAAACPTLAAEKSATVVSVGTCWSGFDAVVAKMSNGDQLFLGDLANAQTKARLSVALSAQASGQSVFYQIYATSMVCSATRSHAEWWVIGGSLFD